LASASPAKRFDFRVLLDDKEIGRHTYTVSPQDALTYVTSEARFDVKFLFITVYTYTHVNNEVWQGDCLRTIDASTDDNGEPLFVRGEYLDQHLSLSTPAGRAQLAGCVRTFAYWDPRLLSNSQLLNAQTGELLPVEVEALEDATITVRGEPVDALHYRIHHDKFRIDLWYSRNQEWLALESTTESGGLLRYEVD
jgi:hypothetical protein